MIAARWSRSLDNDGSSIYDVYASFYELHRDVFAVTSGCLQRSAGHIK